jgi:hypothetical protein
MDEQTVAADTPPVPQKASRWEDYIDVFFSPTELFQRRSRDRLAPPLLTLLALSVVFYFVLLPANMMIMRASVASNPQAAQMMSGTMGTIAAIFGAISQPIVFLVFTTLTALLLWIVGRFADVRTEFSRAMLIATYSMFIFMLAQILALVLVMVMGQDSVNMARVNSFGPLRFIGDPEMNKLALAFLSRVDLFAIWQAVIWAIGLRVTYNISMKRAGIIAAIVWFLMTVPSLLAFAAGGLGGGPPPAAG